MDFSDIIGDYIKPELFVVIPVLIFIGAALKKTDFVKNNDIPFILGVLGIFLAGIYVFSTSVFTGAGSVAAGIFTSLTQGLLLAAASVYGHQLYSQRQKRSCDDCPIAAEQRNRRPFRSAKRTSSEKPCDKER